MKEKTDKILTLVMLAVALLATVFTVLFAMPNSSLIDEYEKDYVNHIQGEGYYTILYIILLCVIGFSILAMLGFWVLSQVEKFMSDSKYWVKFLTVAAICVVIVVVSFLLSSGNDIAPEFLQKFEVTPTVSRLIGAACIMCYILAAGAIVSILYTEVAKLFKKK